MVDFSGERAAIGRIHAVDSVWQAPALLPSRIACCQGASNKVRPVHDGNACIGMTCGTDAIAAAPKIILHALTDLHNIAIHTVPVSAAAVRHQDALYLSADGGRRKPNLAESHAAFCLRSCPGS